MIGDDRVARRIEARGEFVASRADPAGGGRTGAVVTASHWNGYAWNGGDRAKGDRPFLRGHPDDDLREGVRSRVPSEHLSRFHSS
ncbi:MAG TPA: hypothetical protein VGA56_01125 [Opitutaceae bacterium]